MNLTLDLAAVADADELIPMIGRLYAHENIPFHEGKVHWSLEKLLTNDALGFVCIARVDGAPAGYANVTYGYDIEYGGRDATLTDLYVEPAFRHQGIATATLAFVEEACRRHGVEAIELQVTVGNDVASDAYQKAGYETCDRFVMRKRLKDPIS